MMMGTSLGAPDKPAERRRSGSLPTTLTVAPAVRAWLAVAALGAGLLHAALAASAPLPALIVLVAIGAAELGWAVVTLARDRPPAVRASLYLALVPVAAWAAVATVGATSEAGTILALPPLPLAVASALDLAVALTIAVVLRRGRPAAQNTGAARFLASLALSAVAVCGVTVPALSVTDAGIGAVTVHLEHGGH
ncbi:hypothetical protein [Leifsonia sp. NPDC058230]|uniref:hypothetical protein n=1 Tax=Leifsonia sp. NPDC058230 TaxID=3346391 RepID=UPI0036D8D913